MKKHTFQGGIHPLRARHHGKTATSGMPIRDFTPDSVRIPMDMHMGTPSLPCVKKGDHVKIGQVIGEAAGSWGVPVHASVAGVVTAVGPVQQLERESICVTIQNNSSNERVECKGIGDVESAPTDQIVSTVQKAGICGMGGACFPTHVKLSPPKDKTIDTVILNGAECETFLTCDHRLMLETPGLIVDGLRAAMRALNVLRGVIAIEDNKPDAIDSMQKAAEGRQGVEVAVLKTKYPQGGEKQLIFAITGREVPSGGLPMDAGVVVLNVGTAAAIAIAVTEGKPLVNRITTVTGAVSKPENLRLPIGTLFADAIAAAGGYKGEPGRIVMGGTMTGLPAPDDGVSVGKGTNGIVVLSQKDVKTPPEEQCIRCGQCVRACPAGLMPFHLMHLCKANDLDAAVASHLQDCILCGSCSYVCPAKCLLVASLKNGIDQLARRSTK